MSIQRDPQRDLDLFGTTMHLIEIIEEELGDKWEDGVKFNPFFSRTKDGLMLQFPGGLPHTLWTPWGQVTMGT